MKILVINPGSTSTKIAVFEDKKTVFELKLDHAKDPEFQEKFSKPGSVFDQLNFRFQALKNAIKENNITQLDAVVGRGGTGPGIPSGTYIVNDKMIDDLKNHAQSNHASNLGAPLAKNIAKEFGIENHAFIVDPVTTDEMDEKHKITGIPEIVRYSSWHALNQKAIARQYAQDIGKKYEDLNLIVAHLGGGSSFGAHKKGRAINVISPVSGEGPFTPERSGALPAQNLIELCFSGKFTKEECLHYVCGGGGLYALLGTKDMMAVENNYEKYDKRQKDIIDEMIAGISRSICSLIPDFEGEKVDQVLITGGIARWKLVVEKIREDLTATGIGISVYPGEQELEALRDGAIRVLSGEEKAKEY
jgi:butyrate kinase